MDSCHSVVSENAEWEKAKGIIADYFFTLEL
jgi:hypothetical protein